MRAPAAKIYTHRALILGSLGRGESLALGTSEALDNLSTFRALRLFGIEIERVQGGYKIHGGAYETPADVIDVGNSGSTLQFLMGLASRAPGTTVFTGDASIRGRRPLGPYIEALNRWGIECWSTRGNGMAPVVVRHANSRRLASVVECKGTISQWITGLLLLAPFAEKDVTVRVVEDFNEPTYVATTIYSMGLFGVKVEASEDFRTFFVPRGQMYKPATMHIPGDFALAAHGLVLAALSDSHLICTNLDMESVQAEKGIIPFLQQAGVDVRIDREAKKVEIFGGKRPKGLEWDANDTPDLLPILSVFCALAEGRSRIYNIPHARLKESDRLSAMMQLNKMGAKVKEYPDALEFEGVQRLHGARIESFHDHRVQMAFAVAGCLAEGETYISEPYIASVSYPDFIPDMQRLGVEIQVVE